MKNGWHQNKLGNLHHYVKNKRHNEKCPALIYNKGIKFWIQNDKNNRLDGPAVEYPNGYKYWWYQGKAINCQSQAEFERYLRLKLFW